MAAGGGGYGERSLKETPTWAVALVCAVFVVISVIIEHGIHSLAKWFQKRHKRAMMDALEKIKSELMLLGFISLLITVGTKPISMICIPEKAGNHMLPCKNFNNYGKDKGKDDDDKGGRDQRKLLMYAGETVWRRVLAPAGGEEYCTNHGKIPLVSKSGVHQLHIFIFVLAVFHIVYSVLTIVLAKAKMKKWKSWEMETESLEYQFNNDPSRFRFARQTSFVQRHTGLSTIFGLRWIVAFFRQFFYSVTKVDYLTMRHGFINAHFAPNSKFNFHRYIKRSMEDDFKVVVGVSIPLWICSILFQLFNVYGWYTLTWMPILPLMIILIVGAKLEVIIMDMAQQIQEKTTVVRGAPVVEPSNRYFWFNHPRLILFLIHFTLFQNAYQMAYFLWIWYEFGLRSCFHENLPELLIRVILGVALQFLCSYVTFPLYALVTQMGSHMKKAIFEEQTTKAIKMWQKAAKERKKQRKEDVSSGYNLMSPDVNTPSRGTSPLHLLHKHKIGSTDVESCMSSPKADQSETELSDWEGPTLSDDLNSSRGHNNNHHQQHEGATEGYNADFSFVKP